MPKPYIVCHMMESLDGRIDCEEMEKFPGDAEYYETLAALKTPTYVSGKVTAQLHYAQAGGYKPADSTPLATTAFSKKQQAEGYQVIVDTKGTLLWESNMINDCPLVILISEQVTKEYLAYLDSKDISWIAAGADKIDLAQAVNILNQEFQVERLAVVGGGNINAGFLNAGLLDEISIVLAPGIDGRGGMTASFDGLPAATEPVQLELRKVSSYENGVIWLQYGVKNS